MLGTVCEQWCWKWDLEVVIGQEDSTLRTDYWCHSGRRFVIQGAVSLQKEEFVPLSISPVRIMGWHSKKAFVRHQAPHLGLTSLHGCEEMIFLFILPFSFLLSFLSSLFDLLGIELRAFSMSYISTLSQNFLF